VPHDGVRTFLPLRLCSGGFAPPFFSLSQRSPGSPATFYYTRNGIAIERRVIMRSAFIAVLLCMIPFESIAQDGAMKPDGRMWQMWSNSGSQSSFVKAAYVQGAIEGLRVGASLGYFTGRTDEMNDALDYVKPCIEKGPCAGIPLTSLVRPSSNGTWNELKAARTKFETNSCPNTYRSSTSCTKWISFTPTIRTRQFA